MALPAFACAQEDDTLQTIKLDRIPSLPAFAGQTRAPAAPRSDYTVDVITSGLSAPWALVFLPGGDILVSEYSGNLKIVDTLGELSGPIAGLPEISSEGWAGLFDVALDPDFAANQLVYFSYTAPTMGESTDNIPRVARARLNRERHRLENLEVIVDGNGGQEIHFGPDGLLYVSGAGDVWNDDAQDLAIPFGKLLRLRADGSAAPDNPWADDADALDEMFSYGHRDISGMATHPSTGNIWITEHGPRGGDELNQVRPAANFGWAAISYGTDYNGEPIGDGSVVRGGMEQPQYFWRPSIAPSGLAFYSGDMFTDWQNSVFVTALAGQHISRLELDGDRVVAEERLLIDRGQRIRELKEGPDGALYVLTNEESDAPKGTAELLRIYRQE